MTDSRLSPELIREVRARTDLVRLAERATKLRRAGSRFVGLCPFHRERTPSFHVVPGQGFYHCFGCGAHGSAIDFVMATENRPFREAVEVLAEAAGVELPGVMGGRASGGVNSSPRQRKAPVVARPVAVEEVQGRRRAERERAYELWKARSPLAGSVAETYLVEARKLPLAWARACPALGFQLRLGYWIQNAGKGAYAGDSPGDPRPELIWEGPALLAAMQFPDGRFAALHCTYLQPDGAGTLVLYERPGVKRSAKKVRGTPGGAAIRLTPAAAHMVVGEGIETTASAFAARGFWGGRAPAGWAAYSLDNLAGAAFGTGARDPRDRRRRLTPEVPDMSRPGLQLPRDCERVTYLGDGDTKDLAMLEAKLRRAVRRALQLGLAADYVLTPPGTDLNDVLRHAA